MRHGPLIIKMYDSNVDGVGYPIDCWHSSTNLLISDCYHKQKCILAILSPFRRMSTQVACKLLKSVTLILHQILFFVKYALL